MKKLIFLIGALAFCIAIIPAHLAHAGQGGQFTTQRFINGQFLVVSNGATIDQYNLGTNVFYIDDKNLGRFAFMNTNLVASVGQSGTNYIPAAFYWTNNQSYVQSNALIGGWTTNAQTINPPSILDVSGWADAYGETPATACISVTVNGIGSRGYQAGAPTNTLTFTFLKSADGNNYSPGNVINADYMQFAIAGSVATNVTYTTNVPITFLQGAKKVRCSIGSSSVSSGTNVVIQDVSLTGWVP